MLKIDNLKIYDDYDENEIINIALKKNKIKEEDVTNSYILKKSIDARNKNNIYYNYSLCIEVKNENKYPHIKSIPKEEIIKINRNRKSPYHPIIIGSGPAGLFCALKLIEYDYKPIIIEQGSKVEDRIKVVEEYRDKGILNEKCNVQFGEGGAGTFSDGKLVTGVNSPLIKEVLDTFYKFGAPKEITYLNKPHIGTDNLRKIIVNIRKYIEEKGGKYYFDTKFIDYEKKDNIFKVICNNTTFETDSLILAIGHSARDTYKLLKSKKVPMQKKNFSVGLRIEHKQSMINESQYGNKCKLKLPSAEYKLVYHGKERSCYTFCMCPGGEVIASSSEKEAIVTNGMSSFKRDKENANSALLVNVLTTDLPDDVLSGMYFQEELEKKAYILGGKNGNAPVQRVGDFLNNKPSTNIGNIIPSYKPGYKLCDLGKLFPAYITNTLQEGILYFDKKIHGFATNDAILTGVETRSSAPVTILRNEDLESSEPCLYPCGEGAGYAGGITTSAIDGIKVAIKIIERFDS